MQDRVGLAVVGAERDPLRSVLQHDRRQGGQVPARRALPGEDSHALAALLGSLVQRRALVVGLDPRGQVGVQPRAGEAGRVPVHATVAGRGDLRQQLGVARDDTGESITSATPMAPNSSSSWRTSTTDLRTGLSNGDAGTQLEAQIPKVNGRPAAAPARAATPRTPNTFAISCGSAATAVVPCGSTALTNSSTQSLVDSRCIWASMKPGVSAAPDTSRPLVPRAGPIRQHHPLRQGRCRPTPRAGHEDPAAGEQKVGRLVAAGNGNNVGCASACGHRSPPGLEANSCGPSPAGRHCWAVTGAVSGGPSCRAI